MEIDRIYFICSLGSFSSCKVYNTGSSCLYRTASLLSLLQVFKGLIDYLNDWNTEGLKNTNRRNFLHLFYIYQLGKTQHCCIMY